MNSKIPRASTGIVDAAASDDGHPESDDGHPESPATVQDTRAALLKRSKRGFAPVNKVFVQAPAGSESRHGMLATFVTGRDLRGLHAMLLLLGIISSGSGDDGWSTTLPIKVWARALGTTLTTTGQSATTAVSKTLTRLEDRKLITRTRRGRERNIRVTLLREDGSGDPYTRPAAGNRDRFLQLPHTFWLDGWHDRLDLPATAMLLVALHEKPGFELPTEKIPEWYGWSADTAERGLKTLISLGVLTKMERVKKAPLSPSGLTSVNQYTLQPPFAPNPQAIGTTTEKGDTTAASPDRITRRRRPTRPRTIAPATTAAPARAAR